MREKRLDIRRPSRLKVVFEDEFGKGLIYLYSKDISVGGLFLEATPPLKLGAHLFLSFILPGKKRPIRTTGEVVRFVEHDFKGREKVRRDAGIRFLDIDFKGLKQLTDFMQRR